MFVTEGSVIDATKNLVLESTSLNKSFLTIPCVLVPVIGLGSRTTQAQGCIPCFNKFK
jgi:hypothetical protein